MDELLRTFRDFITNNYGKKIALASSRGEDSFFIDFTVLDNQEPKISDELLKDPKEFLETARKAYEELGFNLEPRFTNLPESNIIKVKNIRTKHLSKLVQIDGLVRQASEVRPASSLIIFECPACAQLIEQKQTTSRVKEPKRCPQCGRRGKFTVHEKLLEDVQKIVIEESPEMMEGGEQPQRISVILNKDLVDPTIVLKTCPGSRVQIVGIVEEVPIYLRTGAKSTRFDIHINANSITPMEYEFIEIELSDEDVNEIKKIASDPKIYDKLVGSIAPTIYGYEKIKEAIVVQLFGGVRKKRSDGTIVRGDLHILLVGDPGVSKTQMLKYVSTLAPKARYVSGKGASGVGLTASVVKDEFVRGWSLEAGVLVLANKGIAIIDELDKMSNEDRVAMHEALESQVVTIAKANIHATLNAQASVLAAANPKYARFNPYTPVAEQIDLPATLVNRFDLIFPMKDIPDRERDEKIARHMLDVAKTPKKERGIFAQKYLRKYIAYAKRINPQLTDSAMNELKDFYVSLRNKRVMGDDEVRPIPISPRQLEALVRISEAYARIRLSNKVTRKDAERAINLLKFCLSKIGVDPETGELDIDLIVSGITASQRNKILIIKEVLKDLANRLGNNIPMGNIIEEAKTRGISEGKTEEIIQKMKREGEIFEPKHGTIRMLPR